MTRIPAFAKCTASHWVKLLSAATAPLYTGILVRGLAALAEEMLMILHPSRPTISLAKTWQVRNPPKKFKSNTPCTPLYSISKKVATSASISPISKYSFDVLALAWLPPAPFIRISQGPNRASTLA